MGQALRGADAAARPKRELGEGTPLRPAQPLLHSHPARRACQAHRGQHAHPCAAQQVEGQGLDQGDLKVRVREIGVSDHPPAENSSPGFFLIEKGRATVLPEMLPCYLLPAKKKNGFRDSALNHDSSAPQEEGDGQAASDHDARDLGGQRR